MPKYPSPQVPECLKCLSTWVPKCLMCPSALWVPYKCPSARVLSECLKCSRCRCFVRSQLCESSTFVLSFIVVACLFSSLDHMMTQFGLCEIVSKDFSQIIFLRYRKFFDLWNFLFFLLNAFFYKEMRMRNVYIELLLESILFVLLTFITYYGDQTIQIGCLTGISSPGSWVGFL